MPRSLPAAHAQASCRLRLSPLSSSSTRFTHLGRLVQPVEHVGVLVQQRRAAALAQAQLQRLAVDALGHAVDCDAAPHARALLDQVLKDGGRRLERQAARPQWRPLLAL